MINTTSWPQWMRFAWRQIHVEVPNAHTKQHAVNALRLLAGAAVALEELEEDAVDYHAGSFIPYCRCCKQKASNPHKADCLFAILDRIRAGDGGE